MTWTSKALLAGGALVLALMIAIASFSLGLYVGKGGWVSGPPTIQGPGPGRVAPPPGQGRAQPPSGFPQGSPDLIGRVREASGETLTLDSPQGPRTILLDEETQFGSQKGQPSSPDDLSGGIVVAVFGEPGQDRHSLVARFIVIIPPEPEKPPLK